MLTVNIKNGNNEEIVEAEEVTSYIDPIVKSNTGEEYVELRMPGGVFRTIRYGDVYVMNSSGKTIARYSLSPAPTLEVAA